MSLIPVPFAGNGREFNPRGPDGSRFQVSGLRFIRPTDSLILQHLPADRKGYLIPFGGNAPLLAGCAACFAPKAKIVAIEPDMHDYKAGLRKLEPFKNIKLECLADMPENNGCDTFLFSSDGNFDRLLFLDTVERAAQVLPEGSIVLISMDKARAKELVNKMNEYFAKGSVIDRSADAVLFRGVTEAGRCKWTERLAPYDVDSRDAQLKMVSRPGVFCHARVDLGGIALAESCELRDGDRILDLGCGAGMVGLILAEKARRANLKVEVVMVDSHARAVDCARRNVVLNGFERCSAIQDDEFRDTKGYDLIVANPPYYAGQRIGDRFLVASKELLKRDGFLVMVSKHGDRLAASAQEIGFQTRDGKRKGYDITICSL